MENNIFSCIMYYLFDIVIIGRFGGHVIDTRKYFWNN